MRWIISSAIRDIGKSHFGKQLDPFSTFEYPPNISILCTPNYTNQEESGAIPDIYHWGKCSKCFKFGKEFHTASVLYLLDWLKKSIWNKLDRSQW